MLHAGRAGLARGRWLVAGRRVAEEEGLGGLGVDPVLWNAPSTAADHRATKR